jgi:DNA-binding response OmpR family regulator
MPQVAIIEDNDTLREYISLILQRAGFRILPFRDVPHLESIFEPQEPLLILSDIYLPNGNGIDLVKNIKENFPDSKVIMMSSDTVTLREKAVHIADAILPKPFSAAELLLSVQPLLASGSRRE